MPGYFAELGYVLRLEHLVDAAMALPQEHAAAEDRRAVVAAQFALARVPDGHGA